MCGWLILAFAEPTSTLPKAATKPETACCKRMTPTLKFRSPRFSAWAVRACLALLSLLPLRAQEPPADPVEWSCPMDPEIRAKAPGKCSKCGMDLEPGILTPVEYPLKLSAKPAAVRPGQKIELELRVLDPEKQAPVRKFKLIHERLFHLFLISQDLEYFVHDHPALGSDAVFRFPTRLPKPGRYRVLCDFYPEGGTPQMIPKTIIVPGDAPKPRLAPDLSPKHGANLEVTLETEPPQPIAG